MSELEEVQHFISISKYEGVKKILQNYSSTLEQISVETNKETEALPVQANNSSSVDATQTLETSPVSPPKTIPLVSHIHSGSAYVPIESFAWDQGGYNSAIVTVYIDLEGIGAAKECVNCRFTTTSFDLQILNFNGKNYRLVKDNLEKEIVPEQSKYIVKKDKIVIKLQKVKGEYSFEHWTKLTTNKTKEETEAKKKDPSAGIMDMMKDMYNEGDENMKKIIGEAMLKSQNERLAKGGF
jgi:calcyclin binding protein